METKEQNQKRLQELVIQLEIVHEKIWVFLAPWKEGKMVFLSLEQMKELGDLFNQQEQLKKEFMSVPKR